MIKYGVWYNIWTTLLKVERVLKTRSSPQSTPQWRELCPRQEEEVSQEVEDGNNEDKDKVFLFVILLSSFFHPSFLPFFLVLCLPPVFFLISSSSFLPPSLLTSLLLLWYNFMMSTSNLWDKIIGNKIFDFSKHKVTLIICLFQEKCKKYSPEKQKCSLI